MTLLAVDGLRAEFGTTAVVHDVTFAVDRGERVAIVGESGSGKSVTALSILGLVPPPGVVAAGSVALDGEDLTVLADPALEDIRGRRVAMVFQDALSALDPVFTVGAQVAAVVRRHGRAPSKDAAWDRAVELITAVGIPDPAVTARRYPHQLSGGMRQRALIAAALAGEPDLLIADEPTTAVDVTVQAQLVELLADLSHDRGLAVVLITHDLAVVAKFADRVLVMYGGTIVEESATRDLFRAPRHPYTRGLLDSVPGLDDDPDLPLRAIPGAPPDPAAMPPGCSFAPRCPKATDHCRSEAPPLLANGDRRVACHFPL